MPKVTSEPCLAAATAVRTAAWKAGTSPIWWSEGSSSITACGSALASINAATVAAGAVLRPIGSRTSARGWTAMSRSCSAIRNRCSSLQRIVGGANPSAPTRSTVSCSMLLSEVSCRSCFGRSVRDSGQSRVPVPPERMTGCTNDAITLLLVKPSGA